MLFYIGPASLCCEDLKEHGLCRPGPPKSKRGRVPRTELDSQEGRAGMEGSYL